MIITWLSRCRWSACCCCLISIYKSRMNCDKHQYNNEEAIRWQIVEYHCTALMVLYRLRNCTGFTNKSVSSSSYSFLSSFNGGAFHMQITICLISESWMLYCLLQQMSSSPMELWRQTFVHRIRHVDDHLHSTISGINTYANILFFRLLGKRGRVCLLKNANSRLT